MDPSDDIDLLLRGGVPEGALFAAPAAAPTAADAAPAPAAAPAEPPKAGGAASTVAEDKKQREKKRILRNRELARVSNERRKGRIKAMENELEDTRKTVTTLEESIRKLEEENNDLRNLLENKSAAVLRP